jgi:signal transduction histidine kinase
VQATPDRSPGAGSARGAARAGWRGLIQLAAGPDPVPGWRSWPPRQRQAAYVCIGLVTLVLLVVTLLNGPSSPSAFLGPALRQVQGTQTGMPWPLVLLGPLAVLPLPLAARYPMLAWRIGWTAFLLTPLTGSYWWGGWPWFPVQVPILLLVFCVAGIRQPRLVLWWMWGLTLLAWWLWSGTYQPDPLAHLLGTVAFTAAAIAVDSVSSRRRAELTATALAARTELNEAQLTVLEERTRIARELHDVVAHHMSLIAVRAETAPYRLTGLPEPVRAEFLALSAAAREALVDMRRLLGVLRHEDQAGLAPQPQLADLPVLVESARLAGVAVELSAPVPLATVPPAVGVCAYRIVQESLSNAGQHAPGAPVTVSVGHDARAVTLRVVNGPRGQNGLSLTGPRPQAPRSGHGLAGMRERVALLGGSLTAGPAADGGFVVAAVLPLSAAA